MKITLKTVCYRGKTVFRENHANRKIMRLDIKIYLFRCYEHEDPSSCNTTIYLLWLIHSEEVMGVEGRTW